MRDKGARRNLEADPRRRVEQVASISLAGQAEGDRQPCRPACQVLISVCARPTLSGKVNAVDDAACAQQHCGTLSGGSSDDVGTPVHPVGEVDVKVPRCREHRAIARCHATERVGAGVLSLSGVRLDFSNDHRHAALG
jgi:hypothetical protein